MRFVPVILFLFVLIAPLALWHGMSRSNAARQADAHAQRLVVVTPHNDDIRREFGRAFDLWHQRKYGTAVIIDWRVPGGSTDIRRMLEALYQPKRERNGTLRDEDVGLDVAFGGGDYFYDVELRPLGVLATIHIDPKLLAKAFPQPALAGVKLYDTTRAPDGTPAPTWIGVCLSTFGIIYNPDVYRLIGLPEPSASNGWRDLTNPRLAGLLALADPAHSGSAAVAYQIVIQRNMADAENAFLAQHPDLAKLAKTQLARNQEYQAAISDGWHRGMAELLKIAANARYFTDSSSIVPNDVSRGEAAAGVAIDFYARVTEETVGPNRARFFAPIGATAITPDPVGILHGTKGRRLELAQHFVEFLLSIEGQRLWELKTGEPGGPLERALRRPPIRQDVYADRSGWADDIDPFQSARGFNQRADWMVLFADSRPFWVAAWIDARDSLKDAYRKILAVEDPARRQKLIDALADLPITMQDVENARKQRGAIQLAQGDLDLWRARQQLLWAQRFREHYRQVAEQAN